MEGQSSNVIIAMAIGFALGWFMKPDPNSSLTYGDTGLPKNCRAIVTENIERAHAKMITYDEAMASIQRNCGRYGYSW